MLVTTMDVMTAIRTRRSIRQYQPAPVEPEKIEAILEAARWAPSGVNAQPWQFIVVREPSVRQRLADLILDAHRQVFASVTLDRATGPQLEQRMQGVYSALPQAPVYIVVCLHQKRKYFQPGYEEASLAVDMVSVAAAMENLLLAATALGLGTCWMAAPSFKEKEIRGLLGIPAEVRLFAITPVGYPAENPPPRPRDPLDQIVHYDGWRPKPAAAPQPDYDRLLAAPSRSAAELLASGHQHFTRGALEDALRDFTAALEADPRLALAYRNRGSVHYHKGDYPAAIADFTRALELEPGQAELRYFRGLALRALGRNQEAIADFDAALGSGFAGPVLYYSRALARAGLGQREGALADLDAFLARSQDPQGLQAARELRARLAQGG